MKKSAGNRLFCMVFAAMFFAMMLMPAALWPFFKPHMDTENRENREAAPFPRLGEVKIEQYPAAFESWLADSAPFRNQWMTVNAAINLRVFGVIDSEVVLQGKDGWLFYKYASDSSPLEDYQGTNLYTDGQLAEIAGNLNALQAALAENNIELALIIPPGKELVYRRYMPEDIPMVKTDGRIDHLKAYLQTETSIPVVWPEAGLRTLSETQQVYYKYDTHWNEAGAAYASALLMQALEVEAPLPESLLYGPSETPPLIDLANLSATWKLVDSDTAYKAVNWMPDVEVQTVKADENGFYNAYRTSNKNGKKLLMFRDSFGEDMRIPLAACFEESTFVHINGWDENTLAEEKPDIFVLEVTQRYCDRLLDYLPRMVEWAKHTR